MYMATQKLAEHIGIPLSEENVHRVKPLENAKCKSLVVYGVAIRETNAVRLHFYWPSPNMKDGMFQSIRLTNNEYRCAKVRQYGDATLVGTKMVSW
jgi:hypothetical protein